MINFHRMASSTLLTTSHCLWVWLENVFYRNIRQRASNGHLVTVEANRHRLPNLLSNCGKHRQEVTYTTWLINDDDVLTASTVTLTVTLPVTGTGQTDSPLAEPEVEEETDRFLKTVAKTLWGLLCILDNVVIWVLYKQNWCELGSAIEIFINIFFYY